MLMATPLTVCLVVLGKHVPGLTFIGTLMADTAPLAPEYTYYQRLLARDPGEASDLIERHIKHEPPGTVYDALLLPALNYAELDRMENRLSSDEEAAVIDATRELRSDVYPAEALTKADNLFSIARKAVSERYRAVIHLDHPRCEISTGTRMMRCSP